MRDELICVLSRLAHIQEEVIDAYESVLESPYISKNKKVKYLLDEILLDQKEHLDELTEFLLVN